MFRPSGSIFLLTQKQWTWSRCMMICYTCSTKALLIGKLNFFVRMVFNTSARSSTTCKTTKCSHLRRRSRQRGPRPNLRSIGLKKGGRLPSINLYLSRRSPLQQNRIASIGSSTRFKPPFLSPCARPIIHQWLKLSEIGSDGQSQRTKR